MDVDSITKIYNDIANAAYCLTTLPDEVVFREKTEHQVESKINYIHIADTLSPSTGDIERDETGSETGGDTGGEKTGGDTGREETGGNTGVGVAENIVCQRKRKGCRSSGPVQQRPTRQLPKS